MSFLFGGGRPQLSSEQKIANAEIEVEMVNDMLTRYSTLTPLAFFSPQHIISSLPAVPSSKAYINPSRSDYTNPATESASPQNTAKAI